MTNPTKTGVTGDGMPEEIWATEQHKPYYSCVRTWWVEQYPVDAIRYLRADVAQSSENVEVVTVEEFSQVLADSVMQKRPTAYMIMKRFPFGLKIIDAENKGGGR